MIEKVNDIKNSYSKEASSVTDVKSLNDLRVKYLGKQGLLTELSKMM